MNRKEAMEMAVGIVDKWAEAPTSTGRGIAASADKFASLPEKVEAAIKLAEFLWEVDDAITTLAAQGQAEGGTEDRM